MKQFLFKAIFASSLFLFSNRTVNAQCSLDQVGSPNYSVTCQLSDMAVSPISNILYTLPDLLTFMTGFIDKLPDSEATGVQLLAVVAECKKSLLPWFKKSSAVCTGL